jgi:SAM-dependent methyltransferase
MYWQLRYLKNGLVARIPGFGTLRQLKRKLIPYDSSIDHDTFEQGLQMVHMLRKVGVEIDGAVVLELGSGWKPVIPLIFRAAGAKQVILTDSERLLDARLLTSIASQLASRADYLGSQLDISADLVASRLAATYSEGLESACEKLSLAYLAPIETHCLPYRQGEIDVIISRAVLEHVPRETLRKIILEFARILLPGRGYMCHIVDNSDHWAHVDRRLSLINFLRYPTSVWKWFALNPLDYTNRMRHSEYIELMSATGFSVVTDESEPDQSALSDLSVIPVAAEFRDKEAADLAVLTSRLVAVRCEVMTL